MNQNDLDTINEVRGLKFESPSDKRIAENALNDYDRSGEMFDSTLKWFRTLIQRNGAKFSISLLVALLMPSCVVATKDTYVSLGGKSAYKSATFGVVHDHNKSFRDGTLAAASIAGLYYSAATAAAREASSQVATKEATKTTVNASNNATSVAIEGIKADVTKSTFVPP